MTGHGVCHGGWGLILSLLGVVMGGCSVWSSVTHDSDKPLRPDVARAAPSLDGSDKGATLHSAEVDHQYVQVPTLVADPSPPDYVIGPHDVLHVVVYGQPDMGSPIVGTTRTLGSRVDGHGWIQLPMVGRVHIGGLTVGGVRGKLETLYGRVIQKPWVVVEILEHKSQPVYLIGQFNEAGVYYMDRSTNVVQAIALGHGLQTSAYLRGARLMRGGRVIAVDIYRLLREGAIDQNIWLNPDDVVYVPDDGDQQVFVLGDVDKPGPVPMVDGSLTLTQALAGAGGFNNAAGSHLDQVRVIRSTSPTRGELIVVNATKILEGRALPYPLQAGDIVFLPQTKLGRWNDVIREVLPSLQLIGSILNPFVQLEFLSR